MRRSLDYFAVRRSDISALNHGMFKKPWHGLALDIHVGGAFYPVEYRFVEFLRHVPCKGVRHRNESLEPFSAVIEFLTYFFDCTDQFVFT